MPRAKDKYSDTIWIGDEPICLGFRRSWNTWRVGVRNFFLEAVLTTRRHWWSVELRFSRTPRKDS